MNHDNNHEDQHCYYRVHDDIFMLLHVYQYVYNYVASKMHFIISVFHVEKLSCVSNDRSVVVCQITASFTDCSEGQPLLSFTCVHALCDITTSPMGPDVYFLFPWNQGLPCLLPS